MTSSQFEPGQRWHWYDENWNAGFNEIVEVVRRLDRTLCLVVIQNFKMPDNKGSEWRLNSSQTDCFNKQYGGRLEYLEGQDKP